MGAILLEILLRAVQGQTLSVDKGRNTKASVCRLSRLNVYAKIASVAERDRKRNGDIAAKLNMEL